MATAVYMIEGKKSNNVEYPTVSSAEIAMKNEIDNIMEPNLLGKVYELVKQRRKVCTLNDVPV